MACAGESPGAAGGTAAQWYYWRGVLWRSLRILSRRRLDPDLMSKRMMTHVVRMDNMIVMLTVINAQAAAAGLRGTVRRKITLASRDALSIRDARKLPPPKRQSYAMFRPGGRTIDRRSRNCLTDAKHLAQDRCEHCPPGQQNPTPCRGAGQQPASDGDTGWHGRC